MLVYHFRSMALRLQVDVYFRQEENQRAKYTRTRGTRKPGDRYSNFRRTSRVTCPLVRVHVFSRSFGLSPKLKGTCNVSGFMPGESIQSVPVIFILTRLEMTSEMFLLFHIFGGHVFFGLFLFCFLFCCLLFFFSARTSETVFMRNIWILCIGIRIRIQVWNTKVTANM